METTLIYLLKSAGLSTIFYLLYVLLLQNDTNFQLNRKFLLGGILTSFVLPGIYFTKKIIVAPIDYSQFTNLGSTSSTALIKETINWWQIVGVIYLAITSIFLLKFLFELSQILYLIATLKSNKIGNFNYIESDDKNGPFSFFNYIIYNPRLHSEKELELILLHEKIHAGQLHSLDILISNLATHILWFNPLLWLYKKKIIQNLEYIADMETVKNSNSKKEYLHALVKVSTKNFQPALTNSFYQSFIKKRILMLHKTKKTNSSWKVAIAFPLLLAFMLVFNVKTEASIAQSENAFSLSDLTSTVNEVLELNLNEKTTKDQLEDFQKKFQEKGIQLDFKKVDYYKGRLKSLIVSYTLKDGEKNTFNSEVNNNGNLKPFTIRASFNDNNNLETIEIVGSDKLSWTEAENVKVIRTVKNSHDENGKVIREIVSTKKPQQEPIYIVDGKLTNEEQAKAMDPEKIASINVLKGTKATALYGTSATNGAIQITTRKEGDTSRTSTNIIAFQKDNNVKIYDNNKVRVVSTSEDPQNKPLFIVNGEELEEGTEMSAIDSDKIVSVIVFKNKKAIEKYGQKGKNGIVVIRTKDAKESLNTNDSMYLIKASFSDAQLEELKSRAQKDTGYLLKLNNIKRNSKGIITKIQVKFSGKGHTVNADFNETDGIPDILVGLDSKGGVSISSK